MKRRVWVVFQKWLKIRKVKKISKEGKRKCHYFSHFVPNGGELSVYPPPEPLKIKGCEAPESEGDDALLRD